MELFKLVGRIAVDGADAMNTLDQTSDKAEKTQGKLSKALSAAGRGAVAVGKAVGTGMVVAGAAMAGLTAKAVSLGGELEQNMGGSEQVFKEYAGKMQETAKNAFSNMGLSTSDFLGTANKMGALFQGAGFSIEESSDLASSAMQRAADVASIMGIDTADAMEAIAGAAKGNFTMMDNLGVAMNDTTLQAYALEKGIKKSTSEMTNQEKIGLAMEMFMDKTAYAAGNYARENETLAGSLGTAKAALTNFLDGSGDVDSLVSAFSNAANVIVRNVKDIAPRLISGITDLVNQILPMLPPLLQELLPVIIEGAVSLINGLVSALPSILEVLTGTALPLLLTGLSTIFESLIVALPQFIESICAALPTLLPLLIDGLVSMIVTLCTNFSQIIQPIIDNLPEILISLVDSLISNLPLLIEGAAQLIAGIVSALPQITLALVEAMPSLIMSLVSGLISAAPALIEGWKSIWNSVSSAVTTLFSGCKDKVVEIAGNIKEKAAEKFGQLKEKASEIWGNVKQAASEKWESVKSTITEKTENARAKAAAAWSLLKSKTTSVFSDVVSKASEKWQAVKDAIQKPIEEARDKVKDIVDKIKGFLDFDFKLPKMPLPHFAISPAGWKIKDLLQGVKPTLTVEWYAKAMNNPMIMNDPTIFGYNPETGKFMGGGERGSEVVAGTNTLLGMIDNVVEGKTAALSEKLVAALSALTNAIVGGNSDIIQELREGKNIVFKEREVARMVKAYA